MRFAIPPQQELAPAMPFVHARVRTPHYGRYLEAFSPGQVFLHPRGYSFERAAMLEFARTYMQTNPLYLNVEYARASGFAELVASPQHVFNVVLSLGVQNDSEKAIANLGYYDAQFLRPVYAGDTLRAMTRVVDRRERGPGKPGVAHIQTLGQNQRGEVVLQYERKILVGPQGARPDASPNDGKRLEFPWIARTEVELPEIARNLPPALAALTGTRSYFEDFAVGDVIVHANGRTLTDEHMALTYLVGNTHPLHFDRLYSTSQSGAMGGEPIVYGGLVFAWLDGLASRDVSENAVWELGFTEGYHTQPAVAGDTVGCLSRVLATEVGPMAGFGVVTLQLVGVKNVTAKNALDEHGAELFLKENDKKDKGKEKLPTKIFEIERRLIVRSRP